MSLSTIKSTLENHLKLNLTDIAIKFNNTNYYTKNNIALTPTEISALTFFVEPKVISISSERELMSTSNFINFYAFFQVDIYNKVGVGTGAVYTTIETLDSLFRESNIGSVVCFDTITIGGFVDGEFEIVPHRIKVAMWGN